MVGFLDPSVAIWEAETFCFVPSAMGAGGHKVDTSELTATSDEVMLQFTGEKTSGYTIWLSR